MLLDIFELEYRRANDCKLYFLVLRVCFIIMFFKTAHF